MGGLDGGDGHVSQCAWKKKRGIVNVGLIQCWAHIIKGDTILSLYQER